MNDSRALKRSLDYQVVFDALADARGRLKLETLTARWPSDANAPRLLPRGCIEQWRKAASEDGYLSWEEFSIGLEKAMEADSSRLGELKGDLNPSQAEKKLQALRGADELSSTRRGVQASDIEAFLLSSCSAEGLVQALAKTRREAYKYQQSLSKMALAEVNSKGEQTQPNRKRHSSSNTQRKHSASSPTTPEPSGAIALGHEKEELLKGLEVLERTRQWFGDRLEQLRQEEQQLQAQGSLQQMKAEELLAVLEQGSQESESLKHIRKINSHLGSLALEAALPPSSPPPTGSQPLPSPSRSTLPPPSYRRTSKDHATVTRFPSDPGPSSFAGRNEMKLTPHAEYQLPQYNRPPRPASSGHRSYSTNAMNQVGISGGTRRPPTRTASLREHSKPQHVPVASGPAANTAAIVKQGGRPPKRSMSLKGSLHSSSSLSSSHHEPQRHHPSSQQYPLRGTSSLNELPGSHYHHPSSYPAAVAGGSNQPPARSSFVRNMSTHAPSHSDSMQHLLNAGYHGDLAASYPPPAQRQGQQRNAQSPDESSRSLEHDGTAGSKNVLKKTVKDQSARIAELEAQKAELVKRMFQQKAAASSAQINREDSIVSIVL